jgi:hypothetical protein
LYRGRQYKAKERKLAAEKKRINWVNKTRRTDRYYSAPLILDPTPGGEMKREIAKICQEEGERGGMWVKVMERGGTKLKTVCKSNPLSTPGCKRENCGICTGEKPGRCDSASAGYRCVCKECEEVGIRSIYEGESGSHGFRRFSEHAQAVERRQVEKSALAKHMAIQHGGKKGKFTMEITGLFQSCVARQGDEGMRVREAEQDAEVDIVMNSKSEFHQPPLVRLVAMRGNRNETQDIENQQRQRQHRQSQRGGGGRGGRGGRGVRR